MYATFQNVSAPYTAIDFPTGYNTSGYQTATSNTDNLQEDFTVPSGKTLTIDNLAAFAERRINARYNHPHRRSSCRSGRPPAEMPWPGDGTGLPAQSATFSSTDSTSLGGGVTDITHFGQLYARNPWRQGIMRSSLVISPVLRSLQLETPPTPHKLFMTAAVILRSPSMMAVPRIPTSGLISPLEVIAALPPGPRSLPNRYSMPMVPGLMIIQWPLSSKGFGDRNDRSLRRRNYPQYTTIWED